MKCVATSRGERGSYRETTTTVHHGYGTAIQIVKCGVGDEKFKTHAKCKKIGLTHICSADDVMIFIKGARESLLVVMEILRRLSEFTRLQLNHPKTPILTCCVSNSEAELWANEIGVHLSTPD